MEKFRKLGIIEPILKSIQDQNFEEPTEIQEKSIPLILEGKDVIAGAATGSGKTLAFASGIIKNSERGQGIQSLILTPTRELAEQVSNTLQRFSKNKRLEIIAVYGGVSINPQIAHLRYADVVVGTPGRILDHIDRRTINLDKVKILVLDEADRMLDMGFKYDVEKIIWKCPEKRQTLLFSATISGEVSKLARKYTHHPIDISAEAYVDPSKMTQIFYDVEDHLKFSLLVHFLKHETAGLVMVFCNTQRNTDFVANNLNAAGIDALAIHGGYSQEKRSRTMQKFHSKHVAVLICTDVAARGLDIQGVSHIYNYDIPKTSDEYIHRIGRTARAGKEGKVINLLSRRNYDNFQKVLEDRELNIAKGEMPKIEMVRIQFIDNRSRGFDRFGRRHERQNWHKPEGHRSEGRYKDFHPRSDSFSHDRSTYGEERKEQEHSGESGERRFSGRKRFGSRNFGGRRFGSNRSRRRF